MSSFLKCPAGESMSQGFKNIQDLQFAIGKHCDVYAIMILETLRKEPSERETTGVWSRGCRMERRSDRHIQQAAGLCHITLLRPPRGPCSYPGALVTLVLGIHGKGGRDLQERSEKHWNMCVCARASPLDPLPWLRPVDLSSARMVFGFLSPLSEFVQVLWCAAKGVLP